MTVSVVIATYRRADSLRAAISSVAVQTYPDIEIVLVDDNAEPEWNAKVTSIVAEFSNILYIKNEFNMGSAETRNIGIRESSGEYITFLDDDDVYLPEKIDNQVTHMLTYKSDFSITDLDLFYEDGRFSEHRNRYYIKKFDNDTILKYHMMYHLTGTDSIMFRKEYLIQIGGFEPVDVGDEFYLMLKAIEGKGKISYLAACDIKACVHSKNGLSSGQSKIDGENKLFEYKKQFFKRLTKKDIRTICMRHFAVLAFAEYKRGDFYKFVVYGIRSFINSPLNAINLMIMRKRSVAVELKCR